MTTKITPKITLDGHALEKLFPVGTEAYLEIKQYAINQIIDRMAPTADLEAYVHEQFIKKQFIDVLKNHTSGTNNHNYSLSDKARENIKDYITHLINQQIRSIAQELFNEMEEVALNKFKSDINNRLENFFNEQTKVVTNHCRKFITEKMQEIIKTAIEDTNTPDL